MACNGVGDTQAYVQGNEKRLKRVATRWRRVIGETISTWLSSMLNCSHGGKANVWIYD